MRLDRLAAVAEIVSSAAIVLTLVYLAIQARQANDMLLGNSRQAAIATDVALLTSTIEYPETLGKIIGIDPEQARMQSMLILFVRSREFEWFQYQNGTLDRGAFESYMKPATQWLRSDVGAAFWAGNKEQFDPAFHKFVDEWLEGNSR